MKRIIVAVVIFICFALAWHMLDLIKLKVVGQPNSTGLISTQLEQPFFAKLQIHTDLPIEVDFKTIDTLGFKDSYQLPLMKQKVFDLASLRLIQNIQHEITLNGLDLIGLQLNFEKARALAYAYLPVVNKHLQDKYDVKLLGLWTFGPQELFCRKPFTKLSDLKGIRIRVVNQTMADFIASLGAMPVIISFEETRSALHDQMVDCAITSATSAYSAGWLDNFNYYLPITFNTGINAYAITLSKWNQLNGKQQVTLQKAFDHHIDTIWAYSQQLLEETRNCILSNQACHEKKYNIIGIQLPPEDQALINKQFFNISYKKWVDTCNQEYPQCGQEWLKLAGPIAGFQ